MGTNTSTADQPLRSAYISFVDQPLEWLFLEWHLYGKQKHKEMRAKGKKKHMEEIKRKEMKELRVTMEKQQQGSDR